MVKDNERCNDDEINCKEDRVVRKSSLHDAIRRSTEQASALQNSRMRFAISVGVQAVLSNREIIDETLTEISIDEISILM